MDKRLLAKIEPIEAHAQACGWDTARVEQQIDGCEGVQLVGATTRGNPEAPRALDFGFSVAFGIRWETGRASAMRFDGKPNAVFVMTVEDGTGRFWYGPLRSYVRALDDPEDWTGVAAPFVGVCIECGTALEGGACTNPLCSEWRFGEDFDHAVQRVHERP